MKGRGPRIGAAAFACFVLGGCGKGSSASRPAPATVGGGAQAAQNGSAPWGGTCQKIPGVVTPPATGGNTGTGQITVNSAANAATGASPVGAALVDATVIWSTVQPILAGCVSGCHDHSAFQTYAGASRDLQNIISRTDLNPGDASFMPQGGTKLSLDNRATLLIWANAGAPEDGVSGAGGSSGVTGQLQQPAGDAPAVNTVTAISDSPSTPFKDGLPQRQDTGC